MITPTGFVKFTRNASGATSAINRAYSSMTGMVRMAIANPPGPVVSCPSTPYLRGSCSSSARARSCPTRIAAKTKRESFRGCDRTEFGFARTAPVASERLDRSRPTDVSEHQAVLERHPREPAIEEPRVEAVAGARRVHDASVLGGRLANLGPRGSHR